MRKYFKPITFIVAALVGGMTGTLSALFLSPWRAVLIGATFALLALVVFPARAAAKDRVFDAAAKEIGCTSLSESVAILGQRRSYPARLCVSEQTVTVFFCVQKKVASVRFEKSEKHEMYFDVKERILILRTADGSRGVCLVDGNLLKNINKIYAFLQEQGW